MNKTCNCGGVFRKSLDGNFRCERCGNIYRDEFAIVKEFIDIHNTQNVRKIAVGTGIPMQTVYSILQSIQNNTDKEHAIKNNLNVKTSIDELIKTQSVKNSEKRNLIAELNNQMTLDKFKKAKDASNSKLVVDLYNKKRTEIQNGNYLC